MTSLYHQLEEFSMVAGSVQNLTIPLFSSEPQRQIDVDGMSAQLAISDYINNGSAIVTKTCSTTQAITDGPYSFYCQLAASETKTLRGKYIYQLTITDTDGTIDVLQGIVNIQGNADQSAIA